jgi:DNA-binding beta-propeller fold protein YncE
MQKDQVPFFIQMRGHFRDLEFDYRTAALLLPFWLMALWSLVSRVRDRRDAFGLLLIFVGLSVALGTEVVFVREGWEYPSHRYNTVFKFFLQVWIYFALAAAFSFGFIKRARVSVEKKAGVARRIGRFAWSAIFLLLLLATAAFPIFGTYAVTSGPGARCAKGPAPSLDGLQYMNQGASRAEFLTIHWVNRFVEGQPAILEDIGLPYVHESSRISTNTGVPSVIGWDHHMRERSPSDQSASSRHHAEIEQRKRDVQTMYRRRDKNAVLNLLDRWSVDYIYVGTRERKEYGRDSQKFEGYGDNLDVVFHTRGGTLYRMRNPLSQVYLGEVVQVKAPGERPVESGENMYKGGPGFDNGNFKEPRGIAFDAQGRAYVADTFNHRVQVFNPQGEFLFLFGEQGEMEEQFKEPNDLTVSPAGKIYVLDTWNHRVQVFDLQGRFQFSFGDGLYGPRGIALDNEGNVYVSDTGNGRVVVFSAKGKPLRRIATKGQENNQLDEPVGVAVSDQGEVFVADTGNRSVKVFDKQGRLVRLWSIAEEVNKGRGNEQHLALAPNGNVFLADPAGGQVHVYTPEGKKVSTVSPEGKIPAPGREPLGLAFHPKTQALVMCDRQLCRMIRVPASMHRMGR